MVMEHKILRKLCLKLPKIYRIVFMDGLRIQSRWEHTHDFVLYLFFGLGALVQIKEILKVDGSTCPRS